MSPQPQHRKRASRGSRSFFSGELWRSISRGRSRSALGFPSITLDLSSTPAFPCDPSHHPVTNSPTTAEHTHAPNTQSSASTSLKDIYLRSITRTSSAAPEQISQRRKSRPVSWFSFVRHKTTFRPESTSMPLPQPSSMPSISRSQIGTPVLTSTTNLRVADAENVEYTDILLPDYSSRDLPSSNNDDYDALDSHHVQYSIVHPSTWSSTVRSMKKKLTHKRRASTSVLLETPWARRVAEMKGRANASNTSPGGVSHCVDTCKDGIHHRDGRNDPISLRNHFDDSCSAQGELTSLTFASRNRSTPDFRLPPRLPGLYSGSNVDLLAPSLAKSFAIAIEKLDFNSSPTLMNDYTPISKLRKAKSYLSLHRFVRDHSDRTLNKDDLVIPSSPAIIVSKRTDGQEPSDQSGIEENKKDLYKPKIRASKPIQLRFSGQKKRYIASEPDINSPSGVNPLRMHPEVHNSASSAGGNAPNTPVFPDDACERQSSSINRAVIYSPSTGNLSLYSRTPSPKAPLILPKDRVPQETPTRKPLHKANGFMLRKSMSTFFGKSAGMTKVTNHTPTGSAEAEQNNSGKSRPRTRSDTKLADSRRIADVRTRSKSTPDIHKSDGIRAPWSHQPSTPSPLRKSTMINNTPKCRQRAATTTTPIRVQAGGIMLDRARSSTILSDPEKRYGRYINNGDAVNMVAS